MKSVIFCFLRKPNKLLAATPRHFWCTRNPSYEKLIQYDNRHAKRCVLSSPGCLPFVKYAGCVLDFEMGKNKKCNNNAIKIGGSFGLPPSAS